MHQKFVRWTCPGHCGPRGHNAQQIVDHLLNGGQDFASMDAMGDPNANSYFKPKKRNV